MGEKGGLCVFRRNIRHAFSRCCCSDGMVSEFGGIFRLGWKRGGGRERRRRRKGGGCWIEQIILYASPIQKRFSPSVFFDFRTEIL